MSRPQKMHKPLKGNFNSILGAIAIGSGAGKRAANKAAKARAAAQPVCDTALPPKPKKK